MRIIGVTIVAAALLGGSRAQDVLAPPPQVTPAVPGLELRPAPALVAEPPPPPPPKLWSGGAEMGFSGAAGNSENFAFRLGGDAKRETPDAIFKINGLYRYGTARGVRNENRAFTLARNEWLFGASPWSLFADGSLEWDEFRAFDLRVASHAGLGYRFLKTDTTLLKGRAGAGFSREIGGPSNRFVPELVFGFDFEHKFSDRQKITATVDYYPDLGNFADYRLEARAAYELLVDPKHNLTLKLGLLDRYDSTPEGRKPNDIEYFGALLWKF